MDVRPVSALERLDAILDNPATYELATVIPESDHSHGGRPRQYPRFMFIVFEALLSVYGSARQVEAELAHPLVWNHIRRIINRRFPDDQRNQLPAAAILRHHYYYARGQCLNTN